ncbi:MAG TPA: hypothetical protein VGG64_06625 [Pirellulales bacterium]|jgi:hypothetical protein
MRLYVGPTGSGKNNTVNTDLMPFVSTHWISGIFPNEEPARHFVSELYAREGEGVLPRLVVQRFRDTSRVIAEEIIQQHQNDDPFQRDLADDLGLSFLWGVIGQNRKDFRNTVERPVLLRNGTFAVRAKQRSRVWWSDSWIPLVMRPRHPVQLHAIENCTDQEVRDELVRMSTYSLRDQLALLQPIENLLNPPLRNPVIAARTSRQPTEDRRAALNGGEIRVTILEGISHEAQQMAYALELNRIVSLALSGLERPGILVIDELNKLGVTQNLVTALATLRTYGVDIWTIKQYLAFEDEYQRNGFLQNVDLYLPPQNDPMMAEFGADVMRGLLDEYAVHHDEVTTRQFTRIEMVERETESESSGPNGKTKGKSKTLVPVSIPEITQERRPVYKSARDQKFWKAGDIMNAPIGTVFVKPKLQPPYVRTVREFPNSWGYREVADARFEECLQRVMQKPIFEVPVVNPFPVPAATTTNTARRGGRRRSR